MNTPTPGVDRKPGPTRRRLLAGVSGSVIATVSGCSNLQNPFTETTIDVPDTPEPTYAEWIPASFVDPAVLIRYTSPSTTHSQEAISALNEVTAPAEYIGFDMSAVEYAVAVDSTVVLSVTESISLGSIEESLGEFGYAPKTVYKGFRIYEREDDRTGMLAVGETEVIAGGSDLRNIDSEERIQTVIDTRYGSARTLYDESDVFALTANYLGSPHAGGRILFDGDPPRDEVVPMVSGVGLPATDENVYFTRISAYHDNLTAQQKRDERERRSDVPTPFRSNAVTATSAKGGLYSITVESRISREAAKAAVSDRKRVPHVTLGVERTETGVELTHQGGDEIETDDLTLEISASQNEDELTAESTEQLRSKYSTFEPGDTFDISGGDADLRSVSVIFGSEPRRYVLAG